ncbi:endopeptidase La [Desulfuromonas carbonis]|uniref:endopeptidase La n=1 Tax=Desulfuromonas sp. DDH964 TaxID=1823759 RepID=UPI00078B3445|nr:endopeptidase La [Desulfuromonas sp. DDH964]AMV71934.1 ATP-dependent Lon protease (La) [Desulfuromonas sp. DDH964]
MEGFAPEPEQFPVYPMREQVSFPHMVFPLFVGREEMALLDAALRADHLLVIVTCFSTRLPCAWHDLAPIGTLCRINRIFRLQDGSCKATVEGGQRIRLRECCQHSPFFVARCEPIVEERQPGLVAEALVQSVHALLKIALASGRPLPGDVLKMIDQVEDPGRLADLVAVYLNPGLREAQRILEILAPLERLKEVYLLLTAEVQKLQVQGEIQAGVSKRVGRSQKEYLLREQMRQIQEELGDDDPRQSELQELRRRIEACNLPDAAQRVALRELSRLEHINPGSPEYTVARTYLETLSNVPWQTGSDDQLDVAHAQQVLDADHFGLTEVKERILEYLAVRSLRPTSHGPILCFVGPPGVGKTSLGRSIARALGRQFIRISLGGMKDEAEIRGHRRTYIGALPGRIIQEICRAEVNNPVFMLDEVDKIGQDFRGDPASALLEVLDPEQNDSFTDHYLDIPFDLSRVMFITTANLLEPIPHALRDRMEVIHLSGYADRDKLEIAFRYLIPKQCEENGLAGHDLEFSRAAVAKLIQDYTREAGVRGLERQLAAICRKLARQLAQGESAPHRIEAADVEERLGARKFFTDAAAGEDRVGVVTGLAWTEAGGDIIFVEATRMAGKKDLQLTGSLGEVMQESARTALSFIRSRAADFAIDPSIFERSDLHIHVPAGAIPKDGPSAGITIAVALISLLSGRPARRSVAMTGELTLTGRLLPVGGVREKVLAAHRAGVKTVLLPALNRENLADLEPELLTEIRVVTVASLEEVVEWSLLPAPAAASRPFAPASGSFAAG